ncbi:phosphocarrier protein FPr [Paraburkholderia phenoliruptrix]|uniref:phosphoenolpyruvate--protein phosphotransferase n=1 Tax=Paraburkholderia phenoliruptrix TaxID=252970 RepID=UPI002861F3D0|nr:phosphoenolpyruvate--protein phosphotransferase [Paraburkholderia phenoliruptrix]MDR6423105.1 phosphocarrier protein FPr [Paraburkholderia phenoliruptrix]
MLETPVVVKVHEGLHARPATQFAKLAKRFNCSLKVGRGDAWADAKSAVKLMLLGVKQHDQIILRAEGDDEREAVGQLAEFLADETLCLPANAEGSGGVPAHTTPASAPAARAGGAIAGTADRTDAPSLRGVPASEGLAYGSAYSYFAEEFVADRQFVAPHEVATELDRFSAALEAALRAMLEPRDNAEDHEEIFTAIAEVARSDDFEGAIRALMSSGWSAEAATLKCGHDLASAFAALPDEYMRSRADDIRGLTQTVAATLLGRERCSLSDLPGRCIVIAECLSAPDLARADLGNIAGIVCTSGSATSHVAIIARAHGIPAILGVTAGHDVLRAASWVAIDGSTGDVWLDHSPELERSMARRLQTQREADAALLVYRDVEPQTQDGHKIQVAANLGSLAEIEAAQRAGAMGVGLFRTELLFMDRRRVPSEDEQYEVYSTLASSFAPWPVVIRTLDAGADKPLPGVPFPEEENPFLGWRGIRMCLDCPQIFEPQLRALLRAAVHGNLSVMIPMVADLEEVRRTKAMMARLSADLRGEGIAHGQPKLGIMIETPAAVLTADLLAKEADFFSIGTNDLTQYVMAVDRMNPRLGALYRTDHLAVLQAIRIVCDAARRAKISVGVCGEAASRPELIPTLVKLGVHELSMSPSAILRAKKVITQIDAEHRDAA